MGNDTETAETKKKRSFLSVCIILAGLWTLCAAAVTLYFHAVGNPLDPSVVGILFAPGIGEFGFGALIKVAKEKNDADRAREEAEALREDVAVLAGALEELRADMPKKKAPKAAKGPDVSAVAEQLRIALDALNGADT